MVQLFDALRLIPFHPSLTVFHVSISFTSARCSVYPVSTPPKLLLPPTLYTTLPLHTKWQLNKPPVHPVHSTIAILHNRLCSTVTRDLTWNVSGTLCTENGLKDRHQWLETDFVAYIVTYQITSKAHIWGFVAHNSINHICLIRQQVSEAEKLWHKGKLVLLRLML